jgi:uncharacterized FlaG/YvyC family protein
MGQISVTPAITQTEAPLKTVVANQAAPGVTPEARVFNRSVSRGVQTLNEAGYVGEGREVTFSVDSATKRPVIKVVDTATKEVVQQWPAEYVLQLVAETNKLARDSG